MLFLQLIRNGILNTKNQNPTMGPQILTFSNSSSFNVNMDFSGIKKKTNITIKQKIPPKYPAAHAFPENSPGFFSPLK